MSKSSEIETPQDDTSQLDVVWQSLPRDIDTAIIDSRVKALADMLARSRSALLAKLVLLRCVPGETIARTRQSNRVMGYADRLLFIEEEITFDLAGSSTSSLTAGPIYCDAHLIIERVKQAELRLLSNSIDMGKWDSLISELIYQIQECGNYSRIIFASIDSERVDFDRLRTIWAAFAEQA